jgi:hypothetical protein
MKLGHVGKLVKFAGWLNRFYINAKGVGRHFENLYQKSNEFTSVFASNPAMPAWQFQCGRMADVELRMT